MEIVGTGHRPVKLFLHGSDGYDNHRVHDRLVELALAAFDKYKVTSVVSGMAQGWDQALADAAVRFGIPFDAYCPFWGQEKKWPGDAQQMYRSLLKKAREVIHCSIAPSTKYEAVEAMHRRNHDMVDRAILNNGKIFALWNGSSGGTAECLAYAEKWRVPVVNFWKSWERYKHD